MTTAVQHRRGTTSEHSTFTGLVGEVTIDTTKDTAVIHDGSLAGGYPLAKENLSNVTPTGLPTIDGASTASDDKFFIYDQSASVLKSITRAELNNAIEQDALANVAITGGTINGTSVGATTPSTGAFTTLAASGAVTLNGGTANGVAYLNGSKVLTTGSALTFNGTTLATTTVDATNLEVTNVRALDGTAAFSIASSTGVMSIDDTKFTLQDNTDNTKKALFELSGITTATTRTYTLPNITGSLATIANLSQTFAGSSTFSNTFTLSGTTTNISLGTSQTTGTWTAGGAAQTGTMTLGQSTKAHTLNIGTGATENATTKTINLGTAGVSGSTTAVNIGSAVSGATNNVTINGNPTFNGGTANGVAYLNGSKVLTTGSALTFNGTSFGVPNIDLNNGGSQYLYSSGFGSYFQLTNNANALTFGYNGSEQMRLTSTGLGIGTSSPSDKLTVNGKIRSFNSSTGITIDTVTTALEVAYLPDNWGTSQRWRVYSIGGTATDLTFSKEGNLGLGVTPSAWGSGTKAIQVNSRGVFYANSSNTFVANNYYDDGSSYRYIASAAATDYYQASGAHIWRTAPSGTAGNAISFTQAMTLTAAGNLGVGTTSPDISTYRAIVMDGSAASIFMQRVGGTEELAIYSDSGITQINAASNPLTFATGGTERARITSGGEVYIAGTTDQGAYNLQVNGTGVWAAGAYVNGSDARLKENVQTLTDGLSVVTQLRPVTFQYKAEYSKDTAVQPGFIAQELQQVMADKDYVDGVVQSGPEYLNVAYQSLIPVLVKAIQEQQAIITDLRARVAALEAA